MRVFSLALLFALVACFISTIFGAETTVATTKIVPEAPTPSQYMPFNATNDSGPAAAAAFFSIGGVILVAQVIYCIMWIKRDNEERSKFQSELHDDSGMITSDNSAANHQA